MNEAFKQLESKVYSGVANERSKAIGKIEELSKGT